MRRHPPAPLFERLMSLAILLVLLLLLAGLVSTGALVVRDLLQLLN